MIRASKLFGLCAATVLFTASATAATPPPLSNPNVAPEAAEGVAYYGSLDGRAAVSAAGNAAYSIPIQVPPGRNGMAPQLSINYNSNVQNGMLGIGWFLSGTSKITRCPKTIAQDGENRPVRYDSEDRFCLDGHKLIAVSGTYGANGTLYRTEIDRFDTIKSVGTGTNGPLNFQVKTKNGLTKYYGTSANSRVEGQGSSVVRTWALRQVNDAEGNRYRINYIEDNANGRHYIDRIDYNYDATINWKGDINWGTARASIQFLYSSRPDNLTQYEAGSKVQRTPVKLTNIQTKVFGNVVLDYALSYQSIGVDQRQRITKIEQCSGSGLCKEPIQIEWAHNGATTFTESNMSVPNWWAGSANYASEAATIGYDYNVPRWHDMNGDGKPDYVHPVPNSNGTYPSSNMSFQIKLSSGAGYVTQTWTSHLGGHPKDFNWVDIDGNGTIDLVKVDVAAGTIDASLSTGSGFTSGSPYDTFNYATAQDYTLADMDGDGLIDLVKFATALAQEQSCLNANPWNPSVCPFVQVDTHPYVHINKGNGAGFHWATEWLTTKPSTKHQLLDMTGDGLKDLILDDQFLYTNTGNGFEGSPVVLTHPNGYKAVNFPDVNGDGMLDRKLLRVDGSCYDSQQNTGENYVNFIASDVLPMANIDDNRVWDALVRTGGSRHISVMQGNTLNVESEIKLKLAQSDDGASYTTQTYTYPGESLGSFMQIADVNGDGLMDISLKKSSQCKTATGSVLFWGVWKSTTEYYFCENQNLKILTQNGAPVSQISKITQGLGVETRFYYKPLTDSTVYTKGSSATFPNYDIQDTTQVVYRMTQSNGLGGVNTVDYTYEGLVRNVQGRGDLGFAKITSKDLVKGITTTSEYSQTFPHTSQPTLVERRRTSDNQLLGSIDTTYDYRTTATTDIVFAYVDNRIEKDYALSDGRLLTTKTTTNDLIDAYGNIGKTTVVLQDHETSTTAQTEVTNTFSVSSTWGIWRIGQLTNKITKAWLNGANDPSKDREMAYTYDAGTGRVLTSTSEPGKGAPYELTKTFTYDIVGNRLTETVSGPGIASRTTTTTYDVSYFFPETVTNPLGHVVGVTLEREFGNKLDQEDANGLVTSWTYNDLGQQTQEARPGGATTSTTLYKCYTATGGTCVGSYTESLTSGKAPVRQYFDILGRKTRVRSQSFDGSYVNVDTDYDTQGRAYRTSEPYEDIGTTTIYWNTQSYDFLSRVIALVAADPVSSFTVGYDGFEVQTTDAMNRTETRTGNGLGQIIEVEDKTGTAMTFEYDTVGNRTRVNNSVGLPQARTVYYTYDRLGRVLSQIDPDHGTYTYTYNVLGNKLTEVSPKLAAAGQQVSYQYDLLGRMINRTEPEGTTTWSYDSTTGGSLGLGKLASESMTGFTRSYTYAPGSYGNITGVQTQIGSDVYNSSLAYDSLGRVSQETYPASAAEPAGFTVEYVYSPVGMLEAVQTLGGGTVFYQLTDTDAAGRVTSEWLGDGSTVTTGFEGRSSRIANQQSLHGATNLQQFAYTYDNAGNMLSRADSRGGLTESFTFDSLDRLTSATVGANPTVSYGFDVTGSMTAKSDIGDPYLYNATPAHAVSEILSGGSSLHTFGYDANGNMDVVDGSPMLTWSSYNKPTQISSGSINYQFDYGTDRKRFKKTRNGVVTHYVGGSFEVINPGVQGLEAFRHYIRANGKTVMIRKDDGQNFDHEYVHRDHLGSVTLLTEESTGAVIERYAYDAWGMRRSAVDWVSAVTTTLEDRGYTGHEHLDDVGIIHMNGRVYSPSLGRMMSPDPVTQAPENGQNYNRYAYAFNNPLRYSDPSGFVACTVTLGADGGITCGVLGAIAILGSFGGGCDSDCWAARIARRIEARRPYWEACSSDPACLQGLRDPVNADNDYYSVEFYNGVLPEEGDDADSTGEPSELVDVIGSTPGGGDGGTLSLGDFQGECLLAWCGVRISHPIQMSECRASPDALDACVLDSPYYQQWLEEQRESQETTPDAGVDESEYSSEDYDQQLHDTIDYDRRRRELLEDAMQY